MFTYHKCEGDVAKLSDDAAIIECVRKSHTQNQNDEVILI